MKLLLFIPSLEGGGAERVAANLASAWARSGHEVCLVIIGSLDAASYRLDGRVRTMELKAGGTSRNVVEAVRSNWGAMARMRQTLLSERPAVAIGFMSTANVLLALAAIGLPVATIGTEHRQPDKSKLNRVWSLLTYFFYRHLSVVVALTPEAAKWFSKYTLVRRVRVIPNPVVLPLPAGEPIVPPTLLGRQHRRRILAVGRLEHVKGFDRLIQAFAQITARHVDWELVIVGEGPCRPALEHQIEAMGLVGQVHLAGRVGNIGQWYGSSEFLAMSSYHEGFPNVLIEAMALGLPVVSFDCEAGPRNIVRDGVDGLLVPEGDVEALAKAMQQLMENDEQRLVMGRAALQVRDRFSEESILAAWSHVFGETLEVVSD